MAASASGGVRNNRHVLWRQPFWLGLALLAALLVALALARPLAVPDEGRYAEISRWMLVSGDWLVPRLDGLPFFHKPPLTHWLQAASMAVFGAHPWAARVPGLLLALLMVALTFHATQRQLGEATARRAALMLGTSGGVLIGAPYINHDLGVAAWISTAIWCFALAFVHGPRPHAGWARAGFAACALGVLTKGLIGVVLPGGVLLVWLLWTRQWRKIWRLPWVSGLVLFLLIVLPWFVWIGATHPGALAYLFGIQQLSRYVGTGFNNPQPWWFYLAVLVLLMLPWSVFAVADGIARLRQRVVGARAGRGGARNPWPALCWIWFAVIVGFFSIPQSKIVGYVLPVLPPLAVLAALGWQHLFRHARHESAWLAVLAAAAVALAVVLTLAYPRLEHPDTARDMGRVLKEHLQPGDTVVVAGGYPFDLPFVAQIRAPLVVVQDWDALRQTEGDTWRRELFEAGDFAPKLAATILRTPDLVPQASTRRGYWLVAPSQDDGESVALADGWQLQSRGERWSLYRSVPPRSASPQ